MALPWGLLIFVAGVLYGAFMPGREAKLWIFKTGLLVGIILSLAMVLIGWFTGSYPLAFGLGPLDLLIAAVVLSLIFVVGVWLGDVIEGAFRRGSDPGRRRRYA